MAPKTVYFLIVLTTAYALDQVTKQLVIARIHYGEVMPVIPGFFDLTHVRNPGGAFSFFAHGAFEHRMVFFIGSTSVAIVLLLVFFRQLEPQARLAAVALGAILAGALGNLTDRIVYQEVIDFLDVHLWRGYTWPTFNLADSFIVVGVATLLLEVFGAEEEVESDAGAEGAQ